MSTFFSRFIAIAPYLFVLAITGFAIHQFITGSFMMTRIPYTVGGETMAYATGAFLLLIAVLLGSRKYVSLAVLGLAIIIMVWAIIPRVPIALADKTFGGAWTNLFKALCILFGSFVVARALEKPEHTDGNVETTLQYWVQKLASFSKYSASMFLTVCGVQHFMFAPFVKTLVPVWIPPSQLFWTYLTGVALVLGGLGLLVPRTYSLAARLSGIMVLIWFLTVHIPLAITYLDRPGEVTGCFESLAIGSILVVMYRKQKGDE